MSYPFAELFRTLRVHSAVYFAQYFAAPWGMGLPQRADVQFHVALTGSACVRWAGGVLILGEREVVLFPNGVAHTVSDGSDALVRAALEVAQAIRHGESPFPGDGAQIIVERLAEIFLIQVLRSHFTDQGAPSGLLGVLFDPRLRAGVAAIHSRWAEPLTLEQIARAAGMSRSAFAAAFARAAQVTPMAYLAQWRLMKGRELLADRSLSVAQVAAACGHRSTEGFSRAFRRGSCRVPGW